MEQRIWSLGVSVGVPVDFVIVLLLIIAGTIAEYQNTSLQIYKN